MIFCMQIKCQNILQVDTINLGGHGLAMSAQITQSNKFEKNSFYCNEHQIFFLNDTIIFDECGQICQKYSK